MTDTHRPPLASVPRRLAMVMAGTLLATTIPFAGSAMAETEVITGDGLVPTVRFAGENRFDTAQLIATENTGFEAAFSGDAMIVATGDRFPDALAGSSLGGAEAAPIVLTPSTTAITPVSSTRTSSRPSRVSTPRPSTSWARPRRSPPRSSR